MKLVQHPTVKNFYLPDNSSRFLIFSTKGDNGNFILAHIR